MSTTSSSDADFGSSGEQLPIVDARTKQINKIKEQVIKYAVMAWHDKFQIIYPINGCESYSLKGTLTQRWQGSGRIYLSHKHITVIADSYFPTFPNSNTPLPHEGSAAAIPSLVNAQSRH